MRGVRVMPFSPSLSWAVPHRRRGIDGCGWSIVGMMTAIGIASAHVFCNGGAMKNHAHSLDGGRG